MVSFTDMLEGYRRFRQTGWANQRTKWDELRDGQSPRVMVIACSDSRVDPTQIFDTNPGEMFVVRNVAALVPPYETSLGYHGVSAALEFAVQILEVEEVVVMGHGLCGGCKAALTRDLHGAPHGAGGFIASWISMLDEARERVMVDHDDARSDEASRAMEREGVKLSINNLRTFPWVREKEAAGKLHLKGAYFAISDGILHLLDEESGQFAPYE
jgi:carbonic anhydrase